MPGHSARRKGCTGIRLFTKYPQAQEMGDSMKPITLAAVLLIVLGVAAFAYQGITYTSREKVVDLGPIQVTADKTRTIPLPPIVGAIAIVGGLALLITGSKKG